MMRWMSARRSSGLVSEYDSKARRAAATALSTSAAEPSEILAIASSVAGSMTGKSCALVGGTHFPSM